MPSEEPIFTEADYYWDLEKVYQHFAQGKKEIAPQSSRGLNQTEKLYLRGLLLGNTPTEIAKKLVKSPKGVEVYLCKTLYRYFKKISNTSEIPDPNTSNRHNIPNWCESEGYRTRSFSQSPDSDGRKIEESIKLSVLNFNQNSGTIDIKITLELPSEWKPQGKNNREAEQNSL